MRATATMHLSPRQPSFQNRRVCVHGPDQYKAAVISHGTIWALHKLARSGFFCCEPRPLYSHTKSYFVKIVAVPSRCQPIVILDILAKPAGEWQTTLTNEKLNKLTVSQWQYHRCDKTSGARYAARRKREDSMKRATRTRGLESSAAWYDMRRQ